MGQQYPPVCHLPVLDKIEQLIRTTTKLEVESIALSTKTQSIESKIDKFLESFHTLDMRITILDGKQIDSKEFENMKKDVEIAKTKSENREKTWKKVLTTIYEICVLILTAVLLAKMGLSPPPL